MKELSYIAIRLKEARKNAKMSAAVAGELVGRSDSTIYAWESDAAQPSPEQLIALCKAYKVDISFFYPEDVLSDEQMTAEERTIIQQYRNLNDDARATLRGILDVLGGK